MPKSFKVLNMFNLFRNRHPSPQASLRELADIPSSYPEGTPGRLFFDCNPKEALILVRGVRDAAQQFRTTLLGFLLSWESSDPATFHDTLPLLLRVVRDDFDYEAYPIVELIEQATALYSDPKNAHRSLTEVLTLAMQNLNSGKKHNPEASAFTETLIRPKDAPSPKQN
jgi:hypothetical protein